MPGRHHGDEWLLDHEFEGDARRLRLPPEERRVQLTLHQPAGQLRRWLAGEGDFGRRLLLVQDVKCIRQPHHLLSGQEADRERLLLRQGGAACRFARGFDLEQCQPGMIEKGAAGCGELDAARAALQQLDADLQLQIADLPAQRRLRRVQPPLGSIGEAAFLGNSHEIAQMPELHASRHTLKA